MHVHQETTKRFKHLMEQNIKAEESLYSLQIAFI